MKNFQGTGVALVTPFDSKQQIDWAALEQLLEHCIQGGLEYVVALGTTGETAVLSKQEKDAVLDFVVKTVAGRIGVVAGFGGNSTQEVVEAIQQRNFEGIDGILSVSPYYNKPTQEGVYQHFMKIAEVAPRPIIIYNVPARTGSNVQAATTVRLAKASEKFVAIKEASGDISQVMEIIANKPAHFQVLSGDDNLTLAMMACGAEGVISVVGQACPRPMSDMVRAALRGDFAEARALHYTLMNLTNLLFVEGNPAGIKAALQILNIGTQNLRLPLVPVSDKTYQAIAGQLQLQKQEILVG